MSVENYRKCTWKASIKNKDIMIQKISSTNSVDLNSLFCHLGSVKYFTQKIILLIGKLLFILKRN